MTLTTNGNGLYRNEEQLTNDGAAFIESGMPLTVEITIEGTADILFHRWSNEAVEEKAKAAKGSAAKKTDNIESYIYRLPSGNLALPGEYLRQSIIAAAKFKQDPRSPRKSAMDLFKAAVIALEPLADLGVPTWDYEDRRRCVVQRNAITRVRPALRAGWHATIPFLINLPEYVSPQLLHEVAVNAGRLVGVGDFRPTFGRYAVTRFELVALA